MVRVRPKSCRRPHLRGLALLLLAVPGATVAVMTTPGWVSIAEGCSAFTSNIPGWQDFGVADQSAFPTNGALVLEGRFYQVDEPTAAAAVSLTVTDDTGQSVAGTSQLIVTHPEASANPAKVVWKPDAPLAPNATYTVSWSVETQAPGGALTGSATVATAGSTAAASMPAATGSSSTAERVLGGDVVTCERASNPNACPPQSGTLTFGSKEIDRARAMLYWQLPAGPSPQPLLLEAREIPGTATFAVSPLPVVAMGALEKGGVPVTLNDASNESCVRLVGTDLSNDQLLLDEEVCVAAPTDPVTTTPLKSKLGQCLAPPPGLKQAWCAAHPEATSECSSDTGTSGGCSAAPQGTGAPWAALLLLAAYALRRRNATSATPNKPSHAGSSRCGTFPTRHPQPPPARS